MNTPIATLRWKHDEEKKLNSTHHVYRVPFRGQLVETIEFHRKITHEEMRCFEPCLANGGRWRMVGETEWRTDSLTGALSDGE